MATFYQVVKLLFSAVERTKFHVAHDHQVMPGTGYLGMKIWRPLAAIDPVQKNGSICKTPKSIFKVVAKSLFQGHRGSSIPRDEKAPTPLNSANTPLTSLASSLSYLMSELPMKIAAYSVDLRVNVLNQPLHPSLDPKTNLTGNFAPVGETPPTECLITEGELPPSLKGTYIRNGPNPQYMPIGPYHLWSGDGMLHSIRLSDGRAVYCSRFVKTHKYEIEQAMGFPFIPNVFSGFYGLNDIYNSLMGIGRAIVAQINIAKAFNVANTSLAFFHGNLFALADVSLPYAIRLTEEGDVETVHEYKIAGKAPMYMNAHPKVDTETNEVFCFQLQMKYPYLTFFRCGPDSSNWESVPILSMDHMCYLHDFAITQQHAIFFDTQLEFSLINLLKCRGIPMNYQPTRVSRIGVLPRYAKSDSEMRWFLVPGLNAFHILNGWEEDNHIVLIVPTILSLDHNLLYELGKIHSSLEKLVLDTKTGDVSRTTLSDRCLDMGSINPAYQGKKTRYLFMSFNETLDTRLSGVVKIDLQLECEVASRYYGPGCFGGEVLFVPRSDLQCDEDDGFLVSYVHNETTDESHFVVMDAKSLQFVCKVMLPGRVPYGLHGIFVNDKQRKSR